MKRLVWPALAAVVVALAACEGSNPASAVSAPSHDVVIEPADPNEPVIAPPTDSTTYPPADTATTPGA